MNDITSILHQFKKGLLSAEEAEEKIRAGTVSAPSHTDIDYSRLERTGCPEVIYGAGKTPDQIEEIARSLLAAGQNVLATRLSGEALDYLNRAFPAADMHPEARLMRIVPNPVPRTAGFVGIVSAGTSDQYVAEEAALTAEFLPAYSSSHCVSLTFSRPESILPAAWPACTAWFPIWTPSAKLLRWWPWRAWKELSPACWQAW